MDVYNRGQWSTDESISDDWTWDKEGRKKNGYETIPDCAVGDKFGWSAEAYAADDIETQYPFLVLIGTGNRAFPCLVTDFPGLMMLMKEVLPLVREEREKQLFEIREEEHVWKSRDLEPHQYCKHCRHGLETLL